MNSLTAANFIFSIIPEGPLILPPYKGSTFRGAFGHAFRRVVCAAKKTECVDCILKEKCIYSYIFETPPPSDAKMMRKYKAAPHPFVIEPPEERRMGYTPDSRIEFGLILIGRAIDYLPYFIYTFDELGGIGLGRGKGKFHLHNVSSNGETIYTSELKTVQQFKPLMLPLTLPEMSDNYSHTQLTIRFITPARMVYDGELTFDLEFHILIRQLLRRLSLLYYFHCGGDPSTWDFKGMIEKAKEVKVVSQDLRWHDWERYSARQDTRMKLGGFIGDAVFEGDIEQFMSLIKAGEMLHVGKGTSFGLGKYAIKKEPLAKVIKIPSPLVGEG